MYRLLKTPFQRDNQPAPNSGLEVWCLGAKSVCDGQFPEEFMTAVERIVRFSYRISIKPIAKHPNGPSPAFQNLAAVVRLLPSAGFNAVRQVAFTDTGNFHSDVGWGCMIRTAQSVLANALIRALNECADKRNCLGQPLSQTTQPQLPSVAEYTNNNGANANDSNEKGTESRTESAEIRNISETVPASTRTHMHTPITDLESTGSTESIPAPHSSTSASPVSTTANTEPSSSTASAESAESTESTESKASTESTSSVTPIPSPQPISEMSVLRQFADEPEARYSIHKFISYGEHCGVLPGEWFGPSTAAACIAEFSELPVYRSDGADIYEQDLLNQLNASTTGVLVLSNLRLGIDQVNPIYYNGIKDLLKQKQSVGIAGGRTSASLYFFGCTEDYLLYNDPHEPRQALLISDSEPQVRASVHSRLLHWLPIAELDPSMLVAVYLKDSNDYVNWKQGICASSPNSRVVQFVEGKKPACVIPEDDECEEHEGFFVCDLIN